MGDSSLAQKLHTELWALIVAAKTHKRRADGTLLTDEQEKIEAEARGSGSVGRTTTGRVPERGSFSFIEYFVLSNCVTSARKLFGKPITKFSPT